MLLLDTHVFLWFENKDPKLSGEMLEIIQDTPAVYVSILSFWELAIKSSLGKLRLNASIKDLMLDCSKVDFSILPIHSDHLELLHSLPWIHRDPFDRLLICQAESEKLTLVTADENIKKYPVKTLWKQ